MLDSLFPKYYLDLAVYGENGDGSDPGSEENGNGSDESQDDSDTGTSYVNDTVPPVSAPPIIITTTIPEPEP